MLGRAYADAGEWAQFEDTVLWLTRMRRRVPSKLRGEVARFAKLLDDVPDADSL
ncbi:hypothetical protein GCM10010484_40160 [Actinokineospora globicatena]